MTHMLQIIPIKTPGYYQEPLGLAKTLNFYHKIYFSYNLDTLNKYFYQIKRNTEKCIQISKKSRGFYIRLAINQIENKIEVIEHKLHKIINPSRTKRGLINGLGNIVKFITGNLDQDDLNDINKNIDILTKNQNKLNKKISQSVTIFSNITEKLYNELKIIESNQNYTVSMLHLYANQFEQLYFLQTHKDYLEAFEKQLDVITRTITLTNDEIPNLEIITFSELKEIQNQLLSDYDKNTLITYDSLHPFEILQSTKLGIISINNLIVMALKVPILNPTYYNISRIYPIPNEDSIALIPPAQYYLENGMENRWTDRCQPTIGLYICQSFQLNKCDLQDTSGCDLTKTSGAEAYKLISHGLLTTFSKPKEIIEKCQNIVTRHSVTNNNIILSTCSIIIDNNLITMNTNNTLDIPITKAISYLNKEPGQSINLQSYHLEDISKLKDDLQPLREESILDNPELNAAHVTTTLILIILCICIIIFSCIFRQRIYQLFCARRHILQVNSRELQTLQDAKTSLDEDAETSLDEDVKNSEGRS